MKIFLFSCFLLVASCYCNAQNLVPNPSFEEYTECPSDLAQISRLLNWVSFGNSPDYFNVCANGDPHNIGVPYNQFGFQNPSDGDAYVGFYAFYSNPVGYREYVGVELIQALEKNKRYCLSFDVSLSLDMILSDCASSNIGAMFSTIAYGENNVAPINNNPTLFYNNLISDTLYWTNLSWTFTADSEYIYLAIGNFFNNSNTDTIQYNDGNNIGRSYFYLDNIALIECDSIISSEVESFIEFKVWPNPVSNYLHLYSSERIKKISISDTMTTNLFEIDYPQPLIEAAIDLSFLPNGVYTALVITDNNSKRIYKIIKI